MPDYITPIPSVLAKSLQRLINKTITLDLDYQSKIKPLSNKTVLLIITGTGLKFHINAIDHQFVIQETQVNEADVIIMGTPLALFNLGQESELNIGKVVINGDAKIGQLYSQLFRKLEPDWEEPFTQFFGDELGHQVAKGVKSLFNWTKNSLSTTTENLKDYLVEEKQIIVSKPELNQFLEEVDLIRDHVERLSARINNLTG